MPLKLITAPVAEPVTVPEVKTHTQVEHTADDALIGTLISAARQDAEHRLGRALITQTWEQILDAFIDPIYLPNSPIVSITSVKYIDSAGVEQTIVSTAYTLDVDNEPGRVKPAFGVAWPTPRTQHNAVRVRYVAGYGADGTNVPAAIKNWILLRVKALYDIRSTLIVGQPINAAPRDFADGLLDRYKIY